MDALIFWSYSCVGNIEFKIGTNEPIEKRPGHYGTRNACTWEALSRWLKARKWASAFRCSSSNDQRSAKSYLWQRVGRQWQCAAYDEYPSTHVRNHIIGHALVWRSCCTVRSTWKCTLAFGLSWESLERCSIWAIPRFFLSSAWKRYLPYYFCDRGKHCSP